MRLTSMGMLAGWWLNPHMRVIAGTARGQRLIAPDHPGTRPLTDRAREGIFSAIGSWVENAQVLDLYAGSGGFGIEALSRGATRAVFVENGRAALKSLRTNLERLGFVDRAKVISTMVATFLARPAGEFHVIFLDPPWELPTLTVAGEMATAAGLASSGAEMVVHRRFPDPLPFLPADWSEAGRYRYGDSLLYRVVAPSGLEPRE